MRERIVRFTASDGTELVGALYEPESTGARVGVAIANGTELEFYDDIGGWLAPALAAAGYPALTLNRRDHGRRMGFEAFDEAAADVGVAIAALTGCGVRQVVAIGHSYGAVTVACHTARADDPAIAAVGLFGPVADMRRATINILGGEAAYDRTVQLCRERVASGRGDEVFAIPPMSPQGSPLVQTHRVFLSRRGPDTNAVTTRWAAGLGDRPVLYLRNEGDAYPGTRAPAQKELAAAHPMKQVLTPAVPGQTLRAAHCFADQHDLVARITLDWLREIGLTP